MSSGHLYFSRMLSPAVRRTFAGLFAIWFAALNVTRGTYMACLEHQEAHTGAAGALATSVRTSHAPTPSQISAHNASMSRDAVPHDMSAMTHEAGDAAAASEHQHGPADSGHCTCAGDCCCAAVAQRMPPTRVLFAPLAIVDAPPLAGRLINRPSQIVRYVLPLATAPPVITHSV